ncbi:hypothetical protein KZ829_36375 [Actinoplanes hulinensis]|uniref:Uncharacterized protein n=1 Tax=Actinoplanes hulinensis TaxID=1144547 RepID=A0ABS7BEB5_9ACTN|nr:hypothetical protein [Actinoplanes hulinensis]MBW6439214.1 hypothetical protein [Actinoplanes hulinensis]
MIESEKVLAALGRLGVIEWFRISVGLDPADDLVRPALIVWRYSVPRPEAILVIRDAIGSLDGSVEWHFSAGQRNWGLMPALLKRELDRHLGDSYTGVLADFKRSNQDLCRAANRDLEVMIQFFG